MINGKTFDLIQVNDEKLDVGGMMRYGGGGRDRCEERIIVICEY